MTQPDSIMSAEAFASKLAINPAYGLTGTQQITWTELIKARDEAVRNAALEDVLSLPHIPVVTGTERGPRYGRQIDDDKIKALKTPSKEQS